MKKKFYVNFLVMMLITVLCISCKKEINTDFVNNENKTGCISGKVLYSNLGAEQYGGIIVTLDKTDGLRTESVILSEKKRSIISSSRTVIGNVLTGIDGSYFFENLDAGTYTIYATSSYSTEKAVYTNIVVRENETSIADVLTLTATGSIKGRITQDKSETGNMGFNVFIAGTGFMAITDDAGYYTISDIPAGSSYIVTITRNGIIHSLISNITVKANDFTTIENVNFTKSELETAIVWLGAYAASEDIENPQNLNAYFNTTDGCCYIFKDSKWSLLAKPTDSETELSIGTVLSTEKLTNENVFITVNVTKKDITKIGYVYSANSKHFSNGNEILNSLEIILLEPNSNGAYMITADKNGWYYIAVKNQKGYTAFTEEYITNIDKTAPDAVTNLSAQYNRNTNVISLNWTNPKDEDFDYVNISFTRNKIAVLTDAKSTDGKFYVSDIDGDGSEYVFTVFAVDKSGNKSKSSTVSVTATKKGSVQSISLNRYHLCYTDSDQTITATAKLNNVDLINDNTVVKFLIKDPNGNVTNTVANLYKSMGIATAKLTVPDSSSNSTNSGVTYTVLCKIGEDDIDSVHTARFNVSSGGRVTGISQSYSNSPFSNETMKISLDSLKSMPRETIRITGYNLDLVRLGIQLYDSAGNAYFRNVLNVDTNSVQWTAIDGNNYQTIDTEIYIPFTNDIYTIKVLFDNVLKENYKNQLQVYDVPMFSNVKIPAASITKEENIVTAKINGKNFDTPEINLNNFSITCSSKSIITEKTTFNVVSDSLITATLTIPGTAGKYDIVVTYGDNSIKGVFNVIDSRKYSVGDILLNDGTSISKDSKITNTQKGKAVCVMFGLNQYDVPIGIGLYNTDSLSDPFLEWTTKERSNPFWDIGTDDTDGSDNWSYICANDPEGAAEAEKYYPAFNFANNYAVTFGLTGNYTDGWYIPSSKEFDYIADNLDVVNSVLNELGGNTIRIHDIYRSYEYWTSTSGSSYYSDYSAYSFHFYYEDSVTMSGIRGSWSRERRTDDYRVLCVRSFY